MLKIKKGLKKKIKGKKDKGKEDDLFDPEQLEKYRKELEEKRRAEAEQDPTGSSSSPKDEEWLKFQALTAGVDTILKKTTTDLDKIKESSFYQRKQPIIPENWHEAHSSATASALANSGPSAGDKGDPTWTDFQAEDQPSLFVEEARSNEDKPPQEFVVPESPEEPEVLDDSLFDTSYLDAIASGEIQLAYIPDSPTEEDGDDPFDTSGVADVVKRIEEAEKQAKRQVNLGNVVDFYSGKAGAAVGNTPRPRPGDSSKKARPRPRAVNLLGDDENSVIAPSSSSSSSVVVERPKDLFDELLSSPIKDGSSPLLDKIPVTLVSAVPNIKRDSPKDDKNKFQDILGEFDEISSRVDQPLNSYSSSTAALLASVLEPQPEPEEDEFDDEFAALATESIHKNPSPLPPSAEEVVQEEEEEEDPFDTTFVEKVAPPGKFELKSIESEFLGGESKNNEDDFDFDPRIGEAPVVQRNILEDHSPTGEHPPAIQPHFIPGQKSLGEISLDHSDPFDTSTVEAILPGKAELKLLEEELLKAEDKPLRPKLPNFPIKLSAPAPVLPTDEDDFDFDPRKDEPIKEKASDHLFDTSPTEDELAHKVLTPNPEPEEIELDPFDTSIASSLVLVPGQLELRLLESELVESEPQQPIKRELSDPEFDPRGGEEPDPFIVSVNTTLKTEDIFNQTEEITSHKVLTPQQDTSKSIVSHSQKDYDDPFDTSAIEVLKLLPASELKQIEGELLNTAPEIPTSRPVVLRNIVSAQPASSEPQPPTQPSEPKHLFETDDYLEEEIAHKPLVPAEVPSVFTDPFDTSIAEGVVPGKVEIKILEQELLADGGLGLGYQLSDQDFNPRGGPQPIHPSALSFVSKTLEPTRSTDLANLDSDIDPFDTSFAVDNSVPVVASTGPGKAELKALEAELL